MGKKTFERLSYTSVWQQIDPVTKVLVAGAVAAEVVNFDVTPISTLGVTLDVSVAALKALEVWVRTDKNGRWFLMDIDQLDGSGRTDPGSDISTTPAGAACFISLDCTRWSDVVIKAQSDGASKLVISAGGR